MAHLPSIALLFFTDLLLPKPLHNCFWQGKKKKKSEILLLTSTLRTSTSWGAKSRATAHCQAPCQLLSASFQKKNHPLSPEWGRAPIDTHHHRERNDVKCKYVHSIQTERQTDRWIDVFLKQVHTVLAWRMMQRYKLYVNMLNKETVAVLFILEIDASFCIVFENRIDQIV